MPWHGVIAVISLFLNISSDLLPLTGGSFALLADICTQLILPATKVFVWNQLENKTSSFHLSFDVVTPVQPAIERSTVLNTSLFKVSPILFQFVCFCCCVKSFKYLQQLHPTVRLEHLVRTRHLCFWSTATLCFSPIYDCQRYLLPLDHLVRSACVPAKAQLHLSASLHIGNISERDWKLTLISPGSSTALETLLIL